jgi:hypothetical protein
MQHHSYRFKVVFSLLRFLATDADAAVVYNDFSQGNLDAHGWNAASGKNNGQIARQMEG